MELNLSLGAVRGTAAVSRSRIGGSDLRNALESLLQRIAPCPWGAHIGLSRAPAAARPSLPPAARPLYSPDERRRRDASPWTRVQAVLAPLQFAVFAVSLGLIGRFFLTGAGLEAATASVLVKTLLLYAIMITGSIWEKEVFGRWLFAPAFFWEDAVSMLVLSLQTAYLAALLTGWGSPRAQLLIAVCAYGAYAVNASQFLIKLRAARLAGPAPRALGLTA